MKIGALLDVAERADWRAWLAAHHRTAEDIWLVGHKAHTGRPSLPYNDAVEEALCFGWIDSVRKTVDADRYAHRYSPRKARSGFSQTNKERLARLVERGQVLPAVLAELDLVALDPAAYAMPDDILDALRADAKAWAFFRSTAPSYQRIRVAYVDHARKRGEAFDKRLANLVAKCAAGTQFGYGIEAYY